MENGNFKDKSLKCLKTHFLVKIKESTVKVKMFEDSKYTVKI